MRKNKWLMLGLTLASLTIVSACQQPKNESTTTFSTTKAKTEQNVKIQLKEKGNVFSKKEVPFKEKETVFDALKAVYKVKEDKGFITSIDGHEQNEKENVYWMYTVNGKMAEKGAKEVLLKKGDTIEFHLDHIK